MELFCILTVVAVMGLYVFVKTHRAVHLSTIAQFLLLLFLNEAIYSPKNIRMCPPGSRRGDSRRKTLPCEFTRREWGALWYCREFVMRGKLEGAPL